MIPALPKPSPNGSNVSQTVLFQLMGTPLRCHLFSSFASVILVALLGWIWTHPQSLSSDRVHTPTQINDAMQLVSIQDELRTRFETASDQQRQHQARIQEIAKWLPAERPWDGLREDLDDLADSNRVQLLTLERGHAHTGTRIGVMEARCEIQGSYQAVCAFLQSLANAEHPIWCDEIRVLRGEPDSASTNRGPASQGPANASPEPQHPTVCLARLSLRIPVVGKGTAADQLFKRRRGT